MLRCDQRIAAIPRDRKQRAQAAVVGVERDHGSALARGEQRVFDRGLQRRLE
jgi:hypothetical protein